VGFEVLEVAAKNSSVFWDIMLCSVVEANRCFGRIYSLHLQVGRVNEATNQHGSTCCCFRLTYSLDLKVEAIRSSEASVYVTRNTR
jgi:hypothetical protein